MNNDSIDSLPPAEVKQRFAARYRFFRELANSHSVNTKAVDSLSVDEMRTMLKRAGAGYTGATVQETKQAALASEAGAALHRRDPDKWASPEKTQWSPPSDSSLEGKIRKSQVRPAQHSVWQAEGPGGMHHSSHHSHRRSGMWGETQMQAVHSTTYVHGTGKGEGGKGSGTRHAIRKEMPVKKTKQQALAFPPKPEKEDPTPKGSVTAAKSTQDSAAKGKGGKGKGGK